MNERIKIATKAPNSKKEKSVSQADKTELSQHTNSPIDHILYLQRTIGNQAVQRLFKSGAIQAKLKIGQPGDKYEQEADRVADEVMRMPETKVQRQEQKEEELEEEEIIQQKPLSEQITPFVQRQDEPEEEEKDEEEILRTKEASGQTPEVTPDLESRIQSLKGGGQPLPKSVRAFFEPRIGHDFHHVRIHSNPKAFQMAKALNAKAFTTGRNIVFGADQYTPETLAGKNLLAHELTHVVQQKDQVYLQRKKKKLSRKKKAKGAGKQIIILANGYPGYNSETKEVEDVKKSIWLPNTPDFSNTAYDTQKRDVFGASTADEFFGPLQSGKNKIKRVVFIGHGNSSGLGLSGRPLSWFGKGLTESDLNRWQASINIDIKPKLLKEATLDLYACNVAAGDAFMKTLAQSLGICVRGFSGAVYWCLGYKDHTITSRGRIADKAVKTDGSCKGWYKGINKLVPPVKVCPQSSEEATIEE